MLKRKVIFLKEHTIYEDGEKEYRLIGVFTSKKKLLKYFNKMVTTMKENGTKVEYLERYECHRVGVIWGGGIKQWYMEEGDFLDKDYTGEPVESKITYL